MSRPSSKIKIFRFIDHWVGLPLCVSLGLLNTLFCRKKYEPVDRRGIKKILVAKFFGLGSIDIIFSLLDSIRKSYPNAELVFLTFKSNVSFIEREKLCSKVIYIDDSNFLSFLISTFRVMAYLVLNKVDVFMDLEYYSKFSTLVSFFSRARYRVAFSLPLFWRKSLVNIPIELKFTEHILKIYEDMGRALGIASPIVRYRISVNKNGKVDRFLEGRNIKEMRLLGVNINASGFALCRRPPREYFARVIRKVLNNFSDVFVFLIGSKEEKEYVDGLGDILDINENLRKRLVNTAGLFSLEELFYLLSKMSLVLSVDSGILQFCYSIGSPTASIWGPGSPYTHGNFTKEEGAFNKMIYKQRICSPCLYIYRKEPAHFCHNKVYCANEIDPEEIYQEVEKMLKRK